MFIHLYGYLYSSKITLIRVILVILGENLNFEDIMKKNIIKMLL